MEVLPVDLTAVVAIVMVFSPILILVLGFTARFALKPTVEALNGFLEAKARDDALQIVERRLALLEQEVELLSQESGRLREVEAFHQELSSGPEGGETAPRPPDARPGDAG